MIAGKYKASKIDTESSTQIKKTVNMTSLFQTHLAATPKKPTEVNAIAQSALLNKVSPKAPSAKNAEVSSSEQISSQEKEKVC